MVQTTVNQGLSRPGTKDQGGLRLFWSGSDERLGMIAPGGNKISSFFFQQ